MAQVAYATGIGPSDLLAAPAEVFDALVDLLNEQERKERNEGLMSDLKQRMGKR